MGAQSFADSCDRLYGALSARWTLSITPGEAGLNARGERLFFYLCARRRRAFQDRSAA